MMQHLRLVIIALVAILMLALVVAASFVEPSVPGDDVIIIKGGSLIIQCPKNVDCFEASGNGKYDHKENKDPSKHKKVQLIEVKDESGKVIGSFSSVNFPNGKPTIEITYK
jgi:hypothetical protein